MEKISETIRLITARPELLVPLTVVLVLVALILVRRQRFRGDEADGAPGRKRPFRPTRENPGKPDAARAPSAFRQEAGDHAEEEDEAAIATARRRALWKARIQIIMALISILGLTIIGIVNIL